MSDPRDHRPLPVVFGCNGVSLSSAERKFLKTYKPFGMILFKRNCEDQKQVQWLIKEIRQVSNYPEMPFLIDQEGGRVSRLQPPNWPKHPPARLFGEMYEKSPDWGMEAMQCYARVVGHELRKLGIAVNCAPVLDLLIDGASSAIGDRALSGKPAIVAALARVCAESFLSQGVLPVIKHIPGHGRLNLDPHLVLPTIPTSRAELESDDFVPFMLLKDLPLAMNSHAIFSAIDPDTPASLSSIVNQDIIRDMIGFDGLLFSDDIVMKALGGKPADLARQSLEAGADVVLHCDGNLDAMHEIAASIPPMSEQSWTRWLHALDMLESPDPYYDPRHDTERLDVLLGGLAWSV